MNRKGRTEERKPLLILFSDEAAGCLLAAAKLESPTLNEQQYLFKKKIIHVCYYSSKLFFYTQLTINFISGFDRSRFTIVCSLG